jgi:hypothetical protein
MRIQDVGYLMTSSMKMDSRVQHLLLDMYLNNYKYEYVISLLYNKKEN